MSHIKCEATNCMHNQSSYCIRSSINISGRGANKASSTQCDSFVEFKRADALYNTEFGEMPSFSGGASVKCSVVSCLNNESNLCNRSTLDVSGETANNASETFCQSFDLKI